MGKYKIPKTVRKYVYLVAIAFFALAAYTGWVEPEATPLILALILALLNLTPDDVEKVPTPDDV